jgi:polyketide synthase PksN
MEFNLETIYRRVADGRLSKAAALAMIREQHLPPATATVPPAANAEVAPRPSAQALRPRLALAEPAARVAAFSPATREPKPLLAPAAGFVGDSGPMGGLELGACGSGVYEIRAGQDGQAMRPSATLASLTRCFSEVKERSDAKVVLLSGGQPFFSGLVAEPMTTPAAQAAAAAVRDCALPVLAVVEGDAFGLGWLLGARADFIVCNVSAHYGFTDASSLELARRDEAAFLRERFGADLAAQLLREAVPLPGARLAQAGVSMPAVPGNEVRGRALEWARELAEFPRASLTLLKGHLSRNRREENQRAPEPDGNGGGEPLNVNWGGNAPIARGNDAVSLIGQPVDVPFHSAVIRLAAYPDGVLLATLADRDTKNAFSPALTQGIQALFEHIGAHPEYKVVVLTGYERYFASGGTKEGLLSIHHGTARYSDAPLYELPLRCEVPVIAAMQGHAVGAGWSFAMFCDWGVLAEEGLYSSRFMRYGFTPGFGSTLIFEHRFGRDLGWEILFGARDYTGRELQLRGLRMPVAPAAEVLPLALREAHRLAESSRAALTAAKRRAARGLLARLPAIVQAELAMHDRTFVGNADARAEIERHFDAGAAAVATPAKAPEPEPVSVDATGAKDLNRLLDTLRASLAEELRLAPADLEVDAPFTDLGLDSITGVSWVRRINKQFALTLSANEVYHAPTLAEFARLVRERLPRAASEADPARPEPSPVARSAARPAAPAPESEVLPAPVRYPLTEGQKGLWLLQRLDPEMAAYNVPMAFEIREARWAAALEAVIAAILARHPLLGAVMAADEQGQPYQYLPADCPVQVRREALEELSAEALLARLKAEFKRPFRLDHDPLMRVRLFTCPSGRQVVLITLHHLLFDGTSLAVFIRDLLELWSRAVQGGAPGKAVPAVPAFFDFARWEQAFLRSEEAAQELAYWKRQLAAGTGGGEFPTDRVRPARRVYAGATLAARLPAPLSERLRSLAKARRTSLFTLLLAIYQVLVSRYTRQESLVVGVPVARRPDERYREEMGYYVNMVAIRSAPGAEATFAAYLEQLKWTVLAGLEHSNYPFARLVSDLQVEPSPTLSPVFQTVFVLQNFLPRGGFIDSSSPGLGVEIFPGLHQEGEYDLRFEMIDQDAALELCVAYDASVFDPENMARFIAHYVALAEAIAGNPELNLGDYSILSAAERRLVEQTWNPARKSWGKDCCVHELFEARADQRPESVALVSEPGLWTCRELRERSSTLAACLQARGVRPEDRVALCLQRSPDLVVSVLGVLQAGAAYVPVDPAYPVERLAFLLADSAAKLVLTDAPSAARLQEANRDAVPVLRVDLDWSAIRAEGEGKPLVRDVTPANLAYVIYTSGSTGKPKGVMVEHRQALNTLRHLQAAYPVGEADTYLLKTNSTFDVSVAELFGWFLGAGRLAVLPAGDERLPDRIASAIHDWRVTHVNFVPSALGVFLNAMACASAPRPLDSLKYVMVAGEAFPKDMVAAAVRAFPGARVENIYGPTETAIYASGYACSARGVASANTPIGTPVANTRLYVLDSRRRSVGVGVPGELAIAGDGVARGYLNRPELTAASFVDNPFEPGTRLFLTGDLVRWLPDGQIEYFGRIDQQLKIRGFRVEPGEIEGLLNQHPRVHASAVVASGQGASRRLAAFYVPKPGGEPVASQALASHLAAALPDYMVPRFFAPLDALPLTSSGKVDRRSLAARELQPETQGAKVPPQGAIEGKLAAIWKDLLQLEAISATDRFFEVGGNSLLAVMLADRVSREFKTSFPAAAVFKHATIQAIARQVAPAEIAPAAASLAPAPARPAEPPSIYPAYYEDSVAIIGMSCNFPGAGDLEAFWKLLREGRSGGRFLTPAELRERGVPEALIQNPKFVPLHLAIEGKELFDADFFNIPARNALLMDPQFRHLLTHAWRAVEDAGYAPGTIPRTGVFLSAGNSFYQRALDQSGVVEPADGYTSWVLGQGGTMPALVSFTLGFTGPSLFVHTNCSSSLAGLHLACQSLRGGESQYALVGGASLFSASRDGYLHRPGLNFSSDGRCKPFDAAADGMVGGEGVAVILLKRAREALADGDAIYALVRGVAMNNDGPEKAGFYSPGARGQAAVIETALRATGVDPESIHYLEAHGTGTHLGDPVEIMALSDAYRRHTTRTRYCGLGSVKSNIGHADTAAGLAGCIKLALSLRERTMVPTIHYQTPNPAIDFANSPFYVATQRAPWPRYGAPRRAALSSFGIGGSNVHAILEECPEPARDGMAEAKGPYLVPLSAKNPERLREVMAGLLRCLETHDSFALADVAYTLSVGRASMAARAALVAGDRADLLLKLKQAIAQGKTGDGFWIGPSSDKAGDEMLSADDARAMVVKWKREGRLDKIAQLWARGFALDWVEYYGGQRGRRVHLPTYPFAPDRYALDFPAPAPQTVVPPLRNGHPLLHENASTLRELAFTTVLSGREFFLAHHLVQGRKLLPGVVLLELARATVARLAGQSEPGGVQLRDLVWLRPFSVDSEPRTLRTKLIPVTPERLEIEIRAERTGNESEVLCRGVALLAAVASTPSLDLEALRGRIADRRRTSAECYRAFAEAGFQYGAGFQAIRELALGDGQALARLVLPDAVAETRAAYALHPSLMDAALQTCAILSIEAASMDRGGSSPARGSGLPFALQSVEIFQPCPADAWVWVRAAGGGQAESRLRKFDLDICDGQGRICVQLRGYATRAVDAPALPPTPGENTVLHYRQEWRAKPATSETPPSEPAPRLIWTCGVAPLDLPVSVCRELPGPGGAENLGQWFVEVAGQVYQAVRDALLRKSGGPARFQLVIPSEGPEACLGALAGLFRSARLENPGFAGQVIEVTPGGGEDIAAKLALDDGCPGDFLVRHTARERLVPVWVEVEASTVDPRNLWKDNGVYIITGGSGGLGRLFAREILAHAQAARVILAGRLPVTPAELESWGLPPGKVSFEAVDLSRADEVDAFLQRVRAKHATVDGILHAAGVLRDNFILKKSPAEFQAVLAPKVLGTVLLERATQALKPGFIALFSSGVGWFGGAGQADYATANAFLDRFARFRQGHSGQTKIVAIDWPLWQEGGMRVGEDRWLALQKAGLAPMTTAHGVTAFYAALASGQPQWLVLAGDGDALRSLLTAPARTVPPPVPPSPTAIDEPSLEVRTIEWVRGAVSEVVKRPLDKVAADTPFEKYGIDSILQVTIIEQLQTVTGELAKTLLFEYPTVRELAEYLAREHADALRRHWGGGEKTATPVAEPPAAPAPMAPARPLTAPRDVVSGPAANERDDIAIIGLSGRYPLAGSLAEFWDNLKVGRNCITKADARRWPSAAAVPKPGSPEPGPEYYGGFLPEIDRFDHRLFGVPAEQVMNLSPETRLFLETAWEAFEDAGYARPALRQFQRRSASGVGVFAGVMYHQHAWTAPTPEQGVLGSNATEWHIANRVSHFFDLTGPSLAVNAACSSSLLAIHLACESLRQRSCSMALAGGVNLTLHPSKYGFLQGANLLDAGPASRGFGVGEGYIPGEGVGAVLLKPLRQALRDGDRIHGVIKASFANQAGGRQIYTAPDPGQQTQLIAECVRRSGVDPDTIGYVESAANGSPLGDPIEVLALKKAFRQFTTREGFCALGSVKSNLGHLEAASGISQLTKVLLQLRHRVLAPSIHSRPRNPAIQLQGSPFFIPEDCAPWPACVDPGTGAEWPRRALINSIGAGGTCVSLLVEEFSAPSARPEAFVKGSPGRLLALSAATLASLRALARRWSAYLEQNRALDLGEVARALGRREQLAGFRAALVADSIPEAIAKLGQLATLNPRGGAPGLYLSQELDSDRELPVLAVDARSATELAAHWVAGGGLEFAAAGPELTGLPLYAFDHSRAFGWNTGAEAAPLRSPDETVAERVRRGEMSAAEFEEYLRR